MNATWAKAFGWLQFGAATVPGLVSGGVQHSVQGWAGVLASFLMACGVHAASSTDGSK